MSDFLKALGLDALSVDGLVQEMGQTNNVSMAIEMVELMVQAPISWEVILLVIIKAGLVQCTTELLRTKVVTRSIILYWATMKITFGVTAK